ncbi:hypothetical protein KHA80_18180 [Anaerobacillus sp. HL2]|nr:hypothetical protein KHA80_18180 [Anaerobacillus sp. HL2]
MGTYGEIFSGCIKLVEITPFFMQLTKENKDLLLQHGTEIVVRKGIHFFMKERMQKIYI